MIRILVIVFALVLALAGGAAGLIHFGILPDFTGLLRPPVEAEAAPPPPPPRVEPVFQHISPFLVPIIRNGQIERSLYIGLRLRVNPDKGREVALYHSRLHDAYMRLLFDLVPQQMERRDTLDLAAMKVRLKEVADRLMGPGMVEEVMFQAVFER